MLLQSPGYILAAARTTINHLDILFATQLLSLDTHLDLLPLASPLTAICETPQQAAGT